MSIDENNLKDRLRINVIDLVDSERGLASKLSKSIGKSGSFFGDIKRGKPVNAFHLQAIKNVFGDEKLLQIMATDNECVRSDHNVKPIDPAVQIIMAAEKKAGKKLNPKQREVVAIMVRKEIKRREKESTDNVVDIIKAFKE